MMLALRQSPPGRLKSLLLEGSQPVLLLGAGASVTSGIPGAERTVEKVARWAWCKENGRHPEDFAVRRSDYWPWLTAKPWFRIDVPAADLYPDAIDNLLGVKSDRRAFFEDLINPKGVPPSRGYGALAEILHNGWISTVLTTNFDQCLPRAQVQINRPHRLVTISTPADYVLLNTVPQDPQLVYLHGSVAHYTDKNLTDEVQHLDPDLVSRILPLLRDHPVIVVGYRGAERSVMEDLFLAQANKDGFLHGVYWCVRDENPELPALVTTLAAKIRTNFQIVPISGADDLFEKDLLRSMNATGAQPVRRPSGYSVIGMPPDMRPLEHLSAADLEESLLAARLSQYAERTDIVRPTSIDRDWLDQMANRLDLVRSVGPKVAPTLAGWLLFSRNPTAEFAQVRVEVEAAGPEHWLRARFGADTDVEETGTDSEFLVRRTVAGNLWSQLDSLIDLFALANFQFRLKAEISRTVSAYNAIAIKEMIVNAIVHRDYDRDDPITVRITPNMISVTSPGGLVADIAAQVSDRSFQEAIATRTSPIKGYRNPAMSDLFYGGGQMDRRGSGLSDMVRLTVNNNGVVTFGPSEDNRWFKVTIEARPEAVDEITNTALPISEETVRYASNLIPFEQLPTKVWHAPTSAGSNRTFYRDAQGLAVPPGHVSDGRFFSLYDLESMAEAMVTPFDPSEIETLEFRELFEMPGGEPIALKLMHELLFEHFRAKGLQVEYDRRRAYYGRGTERELKVSYQGRMRKATRTVIKARTRRDSDDVLYYEHKAVSFSTMRFGSDMALVLTPGYMFTRDGMRSPISRERTNALSTRRAARDFNPSVLHDVSFWISVLSGETEGLFALEQPETNDLARFSPPVLLSPRTPTISFNGTSFGDDDGATRDIDEDLERLDAELEALAMEPDDGEREDLDPQSDAQAGE